MRFVETKTPEQQSCLMLHRTRHLLIRQQNAVTNALRAHLAEFGIVAPVGRRGVEELLRIVADANDPRLPEIARACVAVLGEQLRVGLANRLEFVVVVPWCLTVDGGPSFDHDQRTGDHSRFLVGPTL